MSDKGIQVAVGLKRPRLCSQATQTPSTEANESGTQCGYGRGSSGRKKDSSEWTYDDLIHVMSTYNDRQRSFDRVADGGGLAGKVTAVSSLQQRNETSDMQGPIRWLQMGVQNTNKR